MKKALISLGGTVISAIIYCRAYNLLSVSEKINQLRGMKFEYYTLLSKASELKAMGELAASSAVMATAKSKLVAIQFTYESIISDYKHAAFGWIERRKFEKDPNWEFIRESLKD